MIFRMVMKTEQEVRERIKEILLYLKTTSTEQTWNRRMLVQEVKTLEWVLGKDVYRYVF